MIFNALIKSLSNLFPYIYLYPNIYFLVTIKYYPLTISYLTPLCALFPYRWLYNLYYVNLRISTSVFMFYYAHQDSPFHLCFYTQFSRARM